MKLHNSRLIPFVLALGLIAAGPAISDDGGGGEGGNAEVDFTGLVQSLPSGGMLMGDWQVSGLLVHVSALTEVRQDNGFAAVGATVEVRGVLRFDGSVDATRFEVRAGAAGPPQQGADVVGVISALPMSGVIGDWMVGGRIVHVSALTTFDQPAAMVQIGVTVEVKGALRSDGSIDATRIEVRATAPTPGGAPPADFVGAIGALPASGPVGDWTVSDKTVHVSATTVIDQERGALMVGAFVEVTGTVRADGSVDAVRIEVRQSQQPGAGGNLGKVELKGTVEVLASTAGFVGDWTVSGRTVHVSAATEIEQEDGVLAVGSLVELKGTEEPNGSIEARKIEVELGPSGPTMTTANIWLVTSAARSPGRDDSFFTTDLTISNPSAMAAVVQVRFLGHDMDGRSGPAATFTLAAGATRTIPDVLGALFGVNDDFGALRITSSVPGLIVAASTSTPSGAGTFGQGMDAMGRNDFVTSAHPRSIAGVRQDGRFRTNLVIANATEKQLDLDAQLVSGNGEIMGVRHFHLEALQMVQLNDAPRELGAPGDISGARILLSTTTQGAAFAAAATVIDNQTNDPRALLAR